MLPQQRRKIKALTPKVIKAKGLKKAPLQMGHGFYNTSTRPITIVKRNGVSYVLPPTSGVNHVEPGLLVSYSVNATPGVKIDLATLWDEDGESCFKEEREVIKEAVLTVHNRGGYDYFTADVNYFVSLSQLTEMKNIYVPNLDIVVSILLPHEIPPHPFSEVATLERESDNQSSASNGVINMVLIDNAKKLPLNCYINFYGIICLVNPKVQFGLTNGLYINCSLLADDYNELSSGDKKIYISPDELKKPDAFIGLFTTYAEAAVGGNLERSRQLIERELEQLKLQRQLEIEKFKKESDEQRAKHEKDMRALAEEQAQMDHTRKQSEHSQSLVSLDRKDKFEQASTQRKGFLETIKAWGPALAGIAVVMAKTVMG